MSQQDEKKPQYYTPRPHEFFVGMECEFKDGNSGWQPYNYPQDLEEEIVSYRCKYLDSQDITSLGFQSILGLSNSMFSRGNTMVQGYMLDDPQYTKIKVTRNGSSVFEGKAKSKSELKRILLLHEINFAD